MKLWIMIFGRKFVSVIDKLVKTKQYKQTSVDETNVRNVHVKINLVYSCFSNVQLRVCRKTRTTSQSINKQQGHRRFNIRHRSENSDSSSVSVRRVNHLGVVH